MTEKITELENTIIQLQEMRLQEKIDLLNFLREKLGNKVENLVDEHTIQSATNEWQEIAKNQAVQDIPTLIDILWNQMCGESGFQFSMKKEDEIYQMRVTYCPLVDRAKKFDGLDWGYHLYCMSDYGITAGFNPNIEFTRTQTLMQGDECCNHCYTMKSKFEK